MFYLVFTSFITLVGIQLRVLWHFFTVVDECFAQFRFGIYSGVGSSKEIIWKKFQHAIKLKNRENF